MLLVCLELGLFWVGSVTAVIKLIGVPDGLESQVWKAHYTIDSSWTCFLTGTIVKPFS